jgi:hypothetical protein
MRNSAARRMALAVGLACAVAACSSQVQTAAPSLAFLAGSGQPLASGGPGPAAGSWIAARVEQPTSIEGQPTDAPAFCSPCHPILGTYIEAMVAVQGGYLALGHDQPPSHAAAWISSDAATWKRVASLPAPDGSDIAAAVAGSGGAVAVGTSGGAAAVWRTQDGATWSVQSLPPLGSGASEQLTAIAASGSGYVAGGYTQDSTAVKRATFWHSSDGSTWVRSTLPEPAAATEVTGMAATGNFLVAVGISGDERRGSSLAWRSVDGGSSWQAVSSPSFASGRMLAVAASPVGGASGGLAGGSSGGGFSAVGENVDQTAAAAWTSSDGSSWAAVPDQSALDNDGLEMVMTAIAADGSNGFVADGWKSDAGNGSAVVWRSADGSAWTRLPQDPSFSGAGMAAILASPRLLAAGTMGWPDTHAAEVWIAPAN